MHVLLAAIWPELVPAYERLYAGRAYLPKAEMEPRRAAVQALGRRFEVADRRVLRLAPPPDPTPVQQLTLILSDDGDARNAASIQSHRQAA